MKTYFQSRKPEKDRKYIYNFPGDWVTRITQAIAAGITNVVVAAITIFVTALVILGGLWLAYIYLPANIFYIILAVILADIALGIVLRAVFSRR
jgi:hypothetical protein